MGEQEDINSYEAYKSQMKQFNRAVEGTFKLIDTKRRLKLTMDDVIKMKEILEKNEIMKDTYIQFCEGLKSNTVVKRWNKASKTKQTGDGNKKIHRVT